MIRKNRYSTTHRPYCAESGKEPYPKEKQAKSAVSYAKAQKGMILYTYKCVYCGQWHLTKRRPV